jgi:Amt family ammonium transporter
MLLTAVFADKVGLSSGETTTFVSHLYALAVVAPFTFLGAYILYVVSDKTIPMRVSAAEEEMGLDLSQHGESLEIDCASIRPSEKNESLRCVA